MPAVRLKKKSVFYKIVRIIYPYKNALWALRPAKPLGVLSRHPCRIPKPLPLGKGLSVGLPPSPRLGLRPKPHFQKLYRFFDSLTAGYACGAVCNLSLHFNDSDVFSRYLDL